MKRSTLEFKLRLSPDGTLAVPAGPLAPLGAKPGALVHVRISPPDIAADLQSRGIAFEEIERIALVQAEPADNVMRFLLAEGALGSQRGKREKQMAKRRRIRS